MLQMIHEGNKQSGGLVKITTAYGIVGLVKFLDCYYMTLITQRRKVGSIGGNDIYTIKATEVYPIKPREDSDKNTLTKLWRKINQRLNQTSAEIAESRYMGLFQFVDLTKDFFFSYDYDLTNSLQYNYLTRRQAKAVNATTLSGISSVQDMFMWNHYLSDEFTKLLSKDNVSAWILPVIHGSCQQRRFSILGRVVDITLIARRSRHYAGTRYLKRGINVHGKVANDCEIEQIIQLDSGTYAKFSSLLQIRGSIPTYWSQETSVTQPKPPILVNRIDPAYLATQEHFSDLIRRYNLPIVVLDLVKHEERRPREVIVGKEYRQALEVVNSSIPASKQIRYIGLDYSRLSKSSKHGPKMIASAHESTNQLVNAAEASASAAAIANHQAPANPAGIGKEWALLVRQQKSQQNFPEDDLTAGYTNNPDAVSHHSSHPFIVTGLFNRVDLFTELEKIAIYSLSETSFFCSTTSYLDRIKLLNTSHVLDKNQMDNLLLQNGILRTNCIDCLDRTNGGQFALGMQHLTFGLRALGAKDEKAIDPSSKLFLELMEMYGDLGDRLAVQYGGSEAHNKMAGATVSAGPGTSSAAASNISNPTSKQGELLTSIKRYYSNAFTDMVKQDAMNIFLGCFVPPQHPVPLWDLDSDYDLHNRLLRPPDPYVNRILFQEVPEEVKKYLLQAIQHSDHKPAGLFSSYFIRSLDKNLNEEMAAASAGRGAVPDHVRQLVLRSELRKEISSNIQTIVDEAFEHWWREAITAYHQRYQLNSSNSLRIPDPVQPDERSSSPSLSPRSFQLVRTISPLSDSQSNSNQPDSSTPTVPVLPYFDRMHNPHELTCFDDYFTIDCYQPVEVIPDTSTEDDSISAMSMDKNSSATTLLSRGIVGGIASFRAKSLYLTSKKASSSNDLHANLAESSIAPAAPASPRQTASIIDPDYYYGIINPHNYDDLDEALGPSSSSIYATAMDSAQASPHQQRFKSPKSSSSVNSPRNLGLAHHLSHEEEQQLSMSPSANSGTFFGKYVREFGMKARFFVGGLLRKEEDDSANIVVDDKVDLEDLGASTTAMLDRGNFTYHPAWSNDRGPVKQRPAAQTSTGATVSTSHASHMNMNVFKPITSKTLSQYARYAAQARDPMQMMLDSSNQIAYKEFESSMREFSISVDDVASMEELSAEHFVCTTLKSENQYQDLSHMDSAVLASAILYATLIFVEEDLRSNLDELIMSISQEKSPSSSSSNPTVATTEVSGAVSTPTPTTPSAAAITSSSSVIMSLPTIPEESTVIYGDSSQLVTQTDSPRDYQSPPPPPASLAATTTIMSSPRNLTSTTGATSISLPYERALILRPSTRERIINYCRSMQIGSGLETAILNQCQRYLFDQVVLLRDLDESRIAKRMSTLTSSRGIMEYASMFSRELVAEDLDSLSFITSDSPLFSTLVEVDELKVSLSSIQERLRQSREHLLAPPTSTTDETEAGAQDRSKEDDGAQLNLHEYEGFVFKSPDIYVRRTNPFLIVNEVAASKYSALALQ
jgi:hypothetical protein